MRTIPLFIAAFFTALGLVVYFGSPNPTTVAIGNEIKTWGVIIANFAFVYGYISVMLLHSRRLYRRREEKRRLYGSVVFFAVLIFVFSIILTDPKNVNSSAIGLLNVYIFSYIDSGMKTDWAFLPYLNMRLFTLTSTTSRIMFISFIFTALRNSAMISTIWPPIMAIGDWFKFIPLNATVRASTACAGISAVAFCLRALIMKEPGLLEMEVKV